MTLSYLKNAFRNIRKDFWNEVNTFRSSLEHYLNDYEKLIQYNNDDMEPQIKFEKLTDVLDLVDDVEDYNLEIEKELNNINDLKDYVEDYIYTYTDFYYTNNDCGLLFFF
jgi:hypothetical protein